MGVYGGGGGVGGGVGGNKKNRNLTVGLDDLISLLVELKAILNIFFVNLNLTKLSMLGLTL